MAPVDPDKVLAIAVGLESYQYGPEISLAGVGADAVRFAEWAIGCRVPPERVWLACSWAGPKLPRPKRTRSFKTTRASLEDMFLEAAGLAGDLLLVFWSGHGVLNEEFDRVLYPADTRAEASRVIPVKQLLGYLACDGFPGFDSQVIFIDACANYAADMNIEQRLDSPFLDSRGKTKRTISQSTLFAASQGERAAYDRVTRESAFSNALFDWLKEHAALPIDFDGVCEHVDKAFDKLQDRGLTGQTPVARVIEIEGKEPKIKSFGGGLPVSGQIHERLVAAGLSPRQVKMIAEEIRKGASLSPEDFRKELASAIANPPTSNGQGTTDLLATVLTDDDCRKRFIESLSARAVTAQQRQFDLDIVTDRQRTISRFAKAFGVVTLQQARRAFEMAELSVQNPMPSGLWKSLEWAAEQSGPPGYESLVRFAVALEHVTGTPLPDALLDDFADGAEIGLLRARAAGFKESMARLVIESPPDPLSPSQFAWPDRVRVHRRVRGVWQTPRDEPCEPTLEGFRETALPIISQMRVEYGRSFEVGFLMPRAAFAAVPEGWPLAAASPLEDERPLWHSQATVLHIAERRTYEAAMGDWTNRVAMITRRLDYEPPSLGWTEEQSPFAIRDHIADSTAPVQGFGFPLSAVPGDIRADPLIASVAAGAPYLVWLERAPADWNDVKRVLGELVADVGTLREIPDRIRKLRNKDPNGLGSNLRLVWDDPEALPGRSELPGMERRARPRG